MTYVRIKDSEHKPFDLWHKIRFTSLYYGRILYHTQCGLVLHGEGIELTENKQTGMCTLFICQA